MWRAAQALHIEGVEVNFLALLDKLEEWDVIGDGKPVGSISDVTACVNHIPPNAQPRHLAESIYKTALRRSDIHQAHLLASAAYSGKNEDWQYAREDASTYLTGTRGEKARDDKKAPFHLLSIKDVLNQPRPDPLIDGYYSLDSTGLTYAPPGVGKTVLLLDQMAHVALNRAWEGHKVKGGHAVYICAEGQAFLPERLQALMLRLDVEDIPRLHILAARPQLLQPQTVAQLLKTFDMELPEPPVWIAFDTVSQTANGARENDADAMGPYLAAMERIRERTRAFVHAIHHTGKDESRGARSSSVFLGNSDTVTYITKVDDTCLWKCEKQRGGWAPFTPFGFKVESLALDDHADRTGPYIKACDAPENAAEQPKGPPPQVQAVYDVFRELHSEYESHPESPGGVFYGTWEKRCRERKISESTFKNARKRLMDGFNLVWQPDEKGPYYPVGWNPAEGAKGQDGDNGPDLSLEVPSQDEGQEGQPPLEGLTPLSLVNEGRSANGHAGLCRKTSDGQHVYYAMRTPDRRRVCVECDQPEEVPVPV